MGPSWSARPAGARADGPDVGQWPGCQCLQPISARAAPRPRGYQCVRPARRRSDRPGAAAAAAAHPSTPAFSLTAAFNLNALQPSELLLSLGGRRRPSERVPRVLVQPAPIGAALKLPESEGAGGGSGARMGARVGGGGAHGR